MSLYEKILTVPQYCLPQHFLSRMIGGMTECKNQFLKNLFIKLFINAYGVDMQEAVIEQPQAYRNFNAFFTRAIKNELRPIAPEENAITSPADGTISQVGRINRHQIIQAKGHNFNVVNLMGGCTERAQQFSNGSFMTIYLSPKDYHRVHIPYSGQLREMIYIPGKLFSVNARTTRHVPQLFARNERVVSVFDTDIGPMAVIMVGAFFVASISTAWAGTITPPQGRKTKSWHYDNNSFIFLKKGDEVGQFKLGSTAIILFGENKIDWLNTLAPNTKVKMGEKIATSLTQG